MSDEADPTRRWLINASGAAILSGAIPHPSAQAAPAAAARRDAETISPDTITLADYVAKTLDRDRTTHSFNTAFGVHTASPFKFEIEFKNIILVPLRVFEFSHSLGH